MPDLLVLDTSLLIDFRRDRGPAREYVLALIPRGVVIIHPVTATEMLDGARSKVDFTDTARFVGSFKRLHVRSTDFDRCLSLMAEVRLPHGVGWPDCLIAATCLRLGLPIVTLNDRHFKAIAGLSVVRPY